MALFTTALDFYGGVLWSGELQGFIIHEMVPTTSATSHQCVKELLRSRGDHRGAWGGGVGRGALLHLRSCRFIPMRPHAA
jgi:hypothetical protein